MHAISIKNMMRFLNNNKIKWATENVILLKIGGGYSVDPAVNLSDAFLWCLHKNFLIRVMGHYPWNNFIITVTIFNGLG